MFQSIGSQRAGPDLATEQQCVNSVKVEKFAFHRQKKKSPAETDSNFSNHWEFQIMIIHPTKAACILDYPRVTLFCKLATFQAR